MAKFTAASSLFVIKRYKFSLFVADDPIERSFSPEKVEAAY